MVYSVPVEVKVYKARFTETESLYELGQQLALAGDAVAFFAVAVLA